MHPHAQFLHWAKGALVRDRSNTRRRGTGREQRVRPRSQLERLSKLKESGALTKEEFARDKTKLLG